MSARTFSTRARCCFHFDTPKQGRQTRPGTWRILALSRLAFRGPFGVAQGTTRVTVHQFPPLLVRFIYSSIYYHESRSPSVALLFPRAYLTCRFMIIWKIRR